MNTQLLGGRHLDGDVRTASVQAAVWEIQDLRQATHRARWGTVRCDTVLVVAGRTVLPRTRGPEREPRGQRGQRGQRRPGGDELRLTGQCPCRDLVADTLLLMHQYLTGCGQTLHDPPAAVRIHIRRRKHDLIRERRHTLGAQVRTDRVHSSARARGLATDEQRNLLRDVVDEAGLAAPLESQEQLECRLASLRAGRSGSADPVRPGAAPAGSPRASDALIDAVRRDFAAVAAHCSTGPRVNVGTGPHPEYVTWWEAYVERPLGRRGRLSDIPVGTAPWQDPVEGRPAIDVACPWSDGAFALVLDGMVPDQADTNAVVRDRDVLALVRRAVSDDPRARPEHLLNAVVNRLLAGGLVPAGTAEALRTDPARRIEAVDALDAVRHDIGGAVRTHDVAGPKRPGGTGVATR
ncbi:MAG TPA: hypothetical protein VFX70_14045 [Mycobacteriales bacterium]|nr:hypothetical protein [Mycobacteriales bacterium]